jgi:hypothetical protein
MSEGRPLSLPALRVVWHDAIDIVSETASNMPDHLLILIVIPTEVKQSTDIKIG